MAFGEIEPSEWRGGEVRAPAPASKVTFSRRELDRILSLYGRKVAAGEWRDYAIDFLKDRAVFSVFRRASEFPDLPDREESAAGTPAGRLQRHLGDRSHPAPGPRARPGARRARPLAPGRRRLIAVDVTSAPTLRRERVLGARIALAVHVIDGFAWLTRITSAGSARSRRIVVPALGIAQTLAWASSYYLPAILAEPIGAGHRRSALLGLRRVFRSPADRGIRRSGRGARHRSPRRARRAGALECRAGRRLACARGGKRRRCCSASPGPCSASAWRLGFTTPALPRSLRSTVTTPAVRSPASRCSPASPRR